MGAIANIFGIGRRRGRREDFNRATLQDVPVLVEATDPHGKADARTPAMEQWQDLVLLYADRIPILSAAARYYNNAAQRVTYDIVDANTDEPVETTEAIALAEMLNAYPEEMARAVELLFLIGENRMAWIPGEGLRAYGAGELVRRSQSFYILDNKGKRSELPPDARAWRTWEPDRRWSDMATSSHKSMLDLLEAFVIAYAEERAVSIRLAMNTGIMLVSEELFQDEAGYDTSDPSESYGTSGKARLERRFEQMLQMTIKNPRNAASLQPPVIVAPGTDVSKMIAHVSFAAERDKRKIQERLDMLKREYAVGSDLPADVAAGFLADLNHWNARSVDANAWKNFIAPKVSMNANNVFHELAAGLGINTDGWKVEPNGSELIEHQVQSDNATKAWDRGLITDAAARKAYGFNEDDAAAEDDGPEFPIGSLSQSEQEYPELPGQPQNRRSFANDVGRAKLRRMSKDIAASAAVMRKELDGAIQVAAEEYANEIAPDGSLTAQGGTDPLETLRSNIVRAIKAQKETMGTAAARAIATKRATEWYERTLPTIEARADRAAKHSVGVLKRLVEEGRFDAGKARDIRRNVESLGSGGKKNIKSNGEVNTQRPTVAQEDTEFNEMLRDEVPDITNKYGWVHGGSENPFPAHVDLDGTTWAFEEERETLNNPEDYPKSAIYYPGDHSGCTCSYDFNYEVAT